MVQGFVQRYFSLLAEVSRVCMVEKIETPSRPLSISSTTSSLHPGGVLTTLKAISNSSFNRIQEMTALTLKLHEIIIGTPNLKSLHIGLIETGSDHLIKASKARVYTSISTHFRLYTRVLIQLWRWVGISIRIHFFNSNVPDQK